MELDGFKPIANSLKVKICDFVWAACLLDFERYPSVNTYGDKEMAWAFQELKTIFCPHLFAKLTQ